MTKTAIMTVGSGLFPDEGYSQIKFTQHSGFLSMREIQPNRGTAFGPFFNAMETKSPYVSQFSSNVHISSIRFSILGLQGLRNASGLPLFSTQFDTDPFVFYLAQCAWKYGASEQVRSPSIPGALTRVVDSSDVPTILDMKRFEIPRLDEDIEQDIWFQCDGVRHMGSGFTERYLAQLFTFGIPISGDWEGVSYPALSVYADFDNVAEQWRGRLFELKAYIKYEV
jgi:hypothetical protein